MWPSPFGREKLLPYADWHARIGGEAIARVLFANSNATH
jgi:hypothetical protein